MVVRRVPPEIPDLDELGLPPQVERFAEEEKGLVLVTGPPGSGKTTTVAALIDRINHRRAVPHPHHRGPDRGAARRRRGHRHPARGRHRHGRLRRRAPQRAAPGRRRHLRRRARRRRDGPSGAHRRRGRPPRDLDHARVRRGRHRHPPHRPVPGRRAGAGPPVAGRHAARRSSASACWSGPTARAARRRSRSSPAPPRSSTASPTRSASTSSSRCSADGQYHGMQTLQQALVDLVKDGLISLQDALAASARPRGPAHRAHPRRGQRPLGAIGSHRVRRGRQAPPSLAR